MRSLTSCTILSSHLGPRSMAKTHHHTPYIIDLGSLIFPSSTSNFNEQIIIFVCKPLLTGSSISSITWNRLEQNIGFFNKSTSLTVFWIEKMVFKCISISFKCWCYNQSAITWSGTAVCTSCFLIYKMISKVQISNKEKAQINTTEGPYLWYTVCLLLCIPWFTLNSKLMK